MITAPDYINWDGYAELHGSQATYSRISALDFLRATAMSLQMPRSPPNVLVIKEDGELIGQSEEVPEDRFLGIFESEDSVWFKVWTPDETDLLCHYRRDDSGWREHYVIGYLQEAAVPLVEKLIGRFVDETRLGDPELLVVDWGTNAEGFDWDDFWKGNAMYDGPMPDVIGIPHRLVSQFDPQPAAVTSQDLPGHTLFIRQHR